MPTHSKAMNEYETLHALSEAIGFIAVALDVGVLAGVVTQLALLSGIGG